MLDDTTPEPERAFDHEDEALHESLPELGALPLDDYPAAGDAGPCMTERPPPEDYGIPGIDLDHSGQFKVARTTTLKADNWMLEQAQNDFFMGLGLDELKSIAWLWAGRIPMGKLTLIEGESNSGTSFVVTDLAARVTRGGPWPGVTSGSPLKKGTVPAPAAREESVESRKETERDSPLFQLAVRPPGRRCSSSMSGLFRRSGQV